MDYIYPLSEYLTITQGFSKTKPHLGLDFGWCSAHCNQAIIAAEDGTVYERADGWGNTYKQGKKIYGNYVILKHPNGDYTVYGHMMKGVIVTKGQTVKKGQILGYMGNTGYSNGQHLHFELRKGGYSKINYAVDPLDYLAIENANLIVSDKTLFPERIKHRKTTWGTPVPRNSKVDQIEVIASQLRARKEPGLKGEVLGVVDTGIYNVNTYTDMDGYRWYSVEDFWFAYSDSWCKFYPKDEPKYQMTISGIKATQKAELEKFCKNNSLTYTVKEI